MSTTYCPNKNVKEWKLLEKATNIDIATLVWYKNKGNSLDFTPNGQVSTLYNDILNKNKNLGYKGEELILTTLREKASYYLEGKNSWLESGIEPKLEVKEEVINEKINDQGVESELSEKLVGFLNKLNFTTEFKNDLKDSSLYNPTSLTDLIYKAILVKNNSKEEGLLKETAYVAYSFLGKKNKIRTDLIHSVESMDNYDLIFSKYKIRSPQLSDYKIKELIVIEFLADAIKSNYEIPKDSYQNREADYWTIKGNSKLEKKVKYILSKISRFIKNLFSNSHLSNQEYKNLLDDIANSVLEQNMNKFNTNLSSEQQLTNYNKTIVVDPKAKTIIDDFQDLGIILTGSLAIRKQGSLYRSSEEDLHDLDFTVVQTVLTENDSKLLTSLVNEDTMYIFTNVNKIISNKIKNNNLSFLEKIKKKYPNYKITNIFKGVVKGEYTITGKIDDYIIDLFIVKDEVLDKNEKGFQDWQSIFVAKLKMGRPKDIRDFANYVPFNTKIDGKFAEITGFRHFNFDRTKNTSTYKDVTSKSFEDQLIPNVVTENGDVRPSYLFKTLLDYTTKDIAEQVYLNTKTKEFKDWNPILDDSEEPIISIQNNIPVFTNDKDEIRNVFKKEDLHKGLLSVSLLDELIEGKSIEEIGKLNADYINNYQIRGSLIEVRDGNYIVNQIVMNQINSQKLHPVYAYPITDEEPYEIYDPNLDPNAQVTPAESFNTLKLIAQKKSIKSFYEERLASYDSRLNLSNLTGEERANLNKTRTDIITQLHGNKDIKGIIQQIQELINIHKETSITEYLEQDINRMMELSKSDNEDKLNEGLAIAEFYKDLGNIDNNPVFTSEQIRTISKDSDQALYNLIVDCTNKSQAAIISIKSKMTPIIMDLFNNLPQIQTMKIEFPKGITEERLKKPTKDSSQIMGTFLSAAKDENMIPQLAELLLRDVVADHIAVQAPDSDKLLELMDPLEKRLIELGESFNGIPSYKKLYQRNILGGFNDRLISRYSSIYDDALETKLEAHKETINQIYKLKNYSELEKANQDLLNWYKNNTNIFDIYKSAEIRKHIENDNLLKILIPLKESELVTHKDLGISEKHYNEIIEKQIELLDKYRERYSAAKLNIMHQEGIVDYKDISNEGKDALLYWDYQHSPKYGINNYDPDFKSKIYSQFDHNILIPKKQNLKGKDTNYYDSNFDFVEKEEIFYSFVQTAKNIVEYMRNTRSEDEFNNVIKNCLPMHQHNLMETAINNGFWQIKNKITGSFLDSISTFTDINGKPVSSLGGKKGLTDYDINKNFLNEGKNEIDVIFNIEALKLQGNLRKEYFTQGNKEIDDKTSIDQSFITGLVLIQLSNLINCTPNIEDVKRTLKLDADTKRIPIGKILKMYAINNVFEQKSFNLPKTLLFFSRLTAETNARSEIAPRIKYLEYMHKEIKGLKGEERVNAIKAFGEWIDKSVMSNYGTKDFGVSKDKNVYTAEDKKLLKEIDEQLKDPNLPGDIKESLIIIREKIGKSFAWSQTILFITKAIRFKSLGFNPNSEVNNFIQGRAINWQVAESGGYFSYKSYIEVEKLYDFSSKHRKLLNILMTRFDVLQDATNEFQKIGNKVDFSVTKLGKFIKPFGLRGITENGIQTPAMGAFINDIKIKDEKGNESSLLHAFDVKTGMLLPQFRTEENVNNWEKTNGEDFKVFKNKYVAYAKKYGDYDPLSNVAYRSNVTGSAGGLFMSWLPETMYRYWGGEHVNIQAGITEKGIMRSNTPVSAALQGFSVGAAYGGVMGGTFLGVGGYLITALKGDVNTNLNALEELTLHGKVIAQKFFGSPINKIMGKEVIKQTANELYHGSDPQLSQLDIRNLNEIMSNITMQLYILTLALLIKGLFWDWDKEKDKKRRMAYNLLMNRLTSISNETQVYTNPLAFWDMIFSKGPVLTLFSDVYKVVQDVGDFVKGNDTYIAGQYRGKSKLAKDLKRFLPVPFNIGNQLDREFFPNKSLLTKELENIMTPEVMKKKRERSKQRAEYVGKLERGGMSKKAANEMAIRRFP